MIKGIRGATTVEENNEEQIYYATQELLNELVKANQLNLDDIASALFTCTPDLNAAFPATGARFIGWNEVPMVCAQEIPVPTALPKCIRVLLHVNCETLNQEFHHIYLHRATSLRPDLAGK